MEELPKKMIADAIVESVVELRFETKSDSVPELLFGRFADAPAWREFRQARLPTADIPVVLRRLDPNLRFQPAIELVSPDGVISARIGANVMTYSHRKTYGGWDRFGPEVFEAIRHLFKSFGTIEVARIGLRYVNALRRDVHKVSSFSDLNLNIQIGEEMLVDRINVNYKSSYDQGFEITTRLATMEFAEGIAPEDSTALVDIDVYTPDIFSSNEPSEIISWIEAAHLAEKRQFFKVLGPRLTADLRAE